MTTPSNAAPRAPVLQSRWTVIAISGGVALIGAVVLAWRAFPIRDWAIVHDALTTMRPMTAACFVGLGLALGLSYRQNVSAVSRYGAALLAAVVAVIGLARLVWPQFTDASGPLFPATWMPIASALNFVLLGAAIAFLNWPQRGIWIAQSLAILAATLTLLALLGYSFGIVSLFPFAARFPTAIHSLAAFALLSAGILWARPREGPVAVITGDGLGSDFARRLLPAAIIVPWVIGALRLYGERLGLYGTELGLALFASSNILVFALLVWWNARWLNRAEAEFRIAVEAAPNAMVMVDAFGKIRLVNSRTEQLFGYSRHQLIGQPVEILVPERFRAIHKTDRIKYMLAPAARPMGVGRELFGRRQDGSEFPVEIGLNPFMTSTGMVVLSAIVDITERRRAEEAMRQLNAELEERVQRRTAELERAAAGLRASEEQYRAVAETAADAIVSADSHGRIIYVNDAAERAFGYSADELVGQPIAVLMPDRFHDHHRRGFQRFLDTGEARVVGRTVELVGKRKDGSEFPIELSLASWHTDDRVFFTAIIRDVTERKQTEDQVRQINLQLAAANSELEAFSYSVSHDLRAPLRSMAGFSDALLADYSSILDENGQEYLRRVRAAAQRMGSLIDGLLNFSRLARAELRRQDVDLTGVIQEIAAELRRAQPERPVELVIADGVHVFGDPQLLRVVAENLIGNAWKFTSKRDDARIEFGSVEHDSERILFVRDNGAGFDMKYANKLFGAFQRLHGVSEFPGHGIGLATVRRIIHRHGGRIWAEGAEGQGATFYFTLPERS